MARSKSLDTIKQMITVGKYEEFIQVHFFYCFDHDCRGRRIPGDLGYPGACRNRRKSSA
jgi:hypothetical protein